MFVIIRTEKKRSAIIKDMISRQVKTWEDYSLALKFADSCLANDRCDYRYIGRRLPSYSVKEV